MPDVYQWNSPYANPDTAGDAFNPDLRPSGDWWDYFRDRVKGAPDAFGDFGTYAPGEVSDQADDVWDQVTGKDDAEAAAEEIADAAKQDQEYNFPDVEGIFGGQDVEVGPDGNVTIRQNLSPSQQSLLDALYGQLGAGTGSVSDALYGQYTSRLDPQWSGREGDLQARLYNQGLREGDEAYDRAMRDLDMARTDAYSQANRAATLAGGAEQSRLIQALMQAGNPGLQSYWGQPNNVNAAIAQGNLQAGVTDIVDLLPLLGLL